MVRVRTGARADGELFAMGGPVETEPGAHTADGAEAKSYPWIHVPGQRHIGLRGGLVILGLYSIIVSLVTLVLRPRRVQAIEEAITDHPFWVGLIGLVLCIVFGVLLDTTDRLGRWEDAANLSVLGVAGILFVVGTAGVAQAIGELTLPRSNLTSLATGISALAVLQLIPVADRKSTRLNSSHANISYAVFCLKKKNTNLYAYLPPREIRINDVCLSWESS